MCALRALLRVLAPVFVLGGALHLVFGLGADAMLGAKVQPMTCTECCFFCVHPTFQGTPPFCVVCSGFSLRPASLVWYPLRSTGSRRRLFWCCFCPSCSGRSSCFGGFLCSSWSACRPRRAIDSIGTLDSSKKGRSSLDQGQRLFHGREGGRSRRGAGYIFYFDTSYL
jgi:hypothetical protein